MKGFKEEVLGDGDLLRHIRSLELSGFSIKILGDRLVFSSSRGAVLRTCFTKEDIYAFANKRNLYQKEPPEADDPPQAKTSASLDVRIAELEGMLSHLRERGRLAVAQRDQWERRALAAESKLANSNNAQEDLNKK